MCWVSDSYLEDTVGDAVSWTVLRGGYFMNNFLHFKDSINGSGEIAFPAATVPAVDTRDIGRCAAAIALEPSDKHRGAAHATHRWCLLPWRARPSPCP